MPGTRIKQRLPPHDDAVAIVASKLKYARTKLAQHDEAVARRRTAIGPLLPMRNPERHRAALLALIDRYERVLAWVQRAAERERKAS